MWILGLKGLKSVFLIPLIFPVTPYSYPNCQLSAWLITDKLYMAIRTKHSNIYPFGALECTMIPSLKKC